MTIAGSASYWVTFTRNLFAVLAILVGALLAVTLYAKLRPLFRLRVLPRWVDQRRLILRFEIENTSRVLAKVNYADVEVFERPLGEVGLVREPVKFSGKKETSIFNPRYRINPGDVAAVEWIYYAADDVVLQIGFQVELRRRWVALLSKQEQTTTCFVVRPASEQTGDEIPVGAPVAS